MTFVIFFNYMISTANSLKIFHYLHYQLFIILVHMTKVSSSINMSHFYHLEPFIIILFKHNNLKSSKKSKLKDLTLLITMLSKSSMKVEILLKYLCLSSLKKDCKKMDKDLFNYMDMVDLIFQRHHIFLLSK